MLAASADSSKNWNARIPLRPILLCSNENVNDTEEQWTLILWQSYIYTLELTIYSSQSSNQQWAGSCFLDRIVRDLCCLFLKKYQFWQQYQTTDDDSLSSRWRLHGAVALRCSLRQSDCQEEENTLLWTGVWTAFNISQAYWGTVRLTGLTLCGRCQSVFWKE